MIAILSDPNPFLTSTILLSTSSGILFGDVFGLVDFFLNPSIPSSLNLSSATVSCLDQSFLQLHFL